MSNVPSLRLDRLEWFEARIAQWSANAVAIGVSVAEMTAFSELISEARAAYDAQQIARDNAKNATLEWYNANNKMTTPGRDYVTTIKAHAEQTDDPNVYALASIDPPSPPTPATAPTVPFDLNGSVSPNGALTVTWDADRSGPSSGIFFLVARKRAGEATFTILGGTQEKAFIDTSSNVCDGAVNYQAKAVRGTLSSDWSPIITFDIGNGPGLTITSALPSAAKMAA